MSNELQYIATQEDLLTWALALEEADVIAVDTESDSFHSYREKTCLIQMTALGRDVIIDPLALGDVDALRGALECRNRVKIFHDAGYDLLCLQRDFGFRVRNVFDTMLASRIVGERQFGLAAILQRHFGFTADKRYQRSDWSKRPLAEAQLHYARYDTHYLPALRELLIGQLQAQGRLAWAEEEFARITALAAVAPSAPRLAPEDAFWRVQGVKTLAPSARGRLQQLVLLREQLAERIDKPAFKVLPDAVLLQLAVSPPADEGGLHPLPGMRQHFIDRHGQAILAALARATPIDGPMPKLPGRRRGRRILDPEARERYETLREVRRREAEALGLEPEVILSNAVLEELARVPPQSRAALLTMEAFRGWRGRAMADGFYACVAAFAGGPADPLDAPHDGGAPPTDDVTPPAEA